MLKHATNWLNSSLENSFTARAAFVAISSCIVVAAIAAGMLFWTEREASQRTLQQTANRVGERLEISIGVMENAVNDLAKSSMIMTALLDSQGRDTYVSPFLASYRFPLAATGSLALCDLNGQRLAGTTAVQSGCRTDSPFFAKIAGGEHQARELITKPDGHPAWVLYRGVEFTYTGTIEGVIVSILDLEEVLRPTLHDFDLQQITLIARPGAPPIPPLSAKSTASDIVSASVSLFRDPRHADHPLHGITVSKPPPSPSERLLPMLSAFGIGVVFLLGIVTFWTRRFSKSVVAPLNDLTATAKQITNTGDLSLPIPTATVAEVGTLSKAFSDMVETLKNSEQRLEQRVRERTEELCRSQAAADAANIAKSRFLATMSHEIRTPMNGILGMAQMLMMPSLTDSERHEFAGIILSSGKTLLNLLNDILDLSKVESGKLSLEYGSFEPRQVIGDLADLFSETCRQKGLQLEAEWLGSPSDIYQGDAHRLRQMISNLVSNAIKFTTQGTIRIQAREISANEDGAQLEFCVTDTGIGIPKEMNDRLFQPFSQIDNSTTRQFGGSGLGLSIVRNLATLMNGEVGCESEPGRGSRFWFTVRVEKQRISADCSAESNTPAAEPEKDSTAHTSRGNVLVAEDNATNAIVLITLLKKEGFESTLVANGEEALSMMQSGRSFKIVLMDLQMPVMDGYAATRLIREWETQEGRDATPIIAVTADAFAEDRNRCLEAGMDDFLSKPIDFAALRELLARVHAPKSGIRL